jgi:hypothetical protein
MGQLDGLGGSTAMARQFATIEVKRERGELKLIGTKTTPRGTKFIWKVEPLGVKSMKDKEFKAKLATAMDKLFG